MRHKVSGNEKLTEERRRSSGVIVSLLVVVFFSFFAAHWHDKQLVDHIEITGASVLSTDAVRRIADSCMQCRRSSVHLTDIRSKVENIPFVRNAFVYFSGVRGVTVEVEERQPVAHVVQADGTLRLVDAQGVVLPKVSCQQAFNIPIIRGGHTLKQWEIECAVRLLTFASCTLEPSLYQSLSEMLIAKDGTVQLITDRTTWQLGALDTKQSMEAFTDMNVFWSQTAFGSITSSAQEIDLRWHHHVIVRSKPIPSDT